MPSAVNFLKFPLIQFHLTNVILPIHESHDGLTEIVHCFSREIASYLVLRANMKVMFVQRYNQMNERNSTTSETAVDNIVLTFSGH